MIEPIDAKNFDKLKEKNETNKISTQLALIKKTIIEWSLTCTFHCYPKIFQYDKYVAQFIFGPLLIFINDLAFIVELACKLFADDTTLYATTTNVTDSLENLIKYLFTLSKPFKPTLTSNKVDNF